MSIETQINTAGGKFSIRLNGSVEFFNTKLDAMMAVKTDEIMRAAKAELMSGYEAEAQEFAQATGKKTAKIVVQYLEWLDSGRPGAVEVKEEPVVEPKPEPVEVMPEPTDDLDEDDAPPWDTNDVPEEKDSFDDGDYFNAPLTEKEAEKADEKKVEDTDFDSDLIFDDMEDNLFG